MVEKVFKQIGWANKNDLLDVIATRTNSPMMKSSSTINPNFISNDINRLDVFSHNIVTGLYIDGVLDCFAYVHLWPELPSTYSHIVFSRFKEEGREKFPYSKLDKNLVEMITETTKLMESKGYYSYYSQLQDVDWEGFSGVRESRSSLYTHVLVEKIPAGEQSKSSIFRNHLSTRIFDSPTKIVFHSLPTEFRYKKAAE